jgi:hypothetical protein
LFHTARQCFGKDGEQRPDIVDSKDTNTNTDPIVTRPRPECDKTRNGGDCTSGVVPRPDGKGGDINLGGQLPGGSRVDTTVKVNGNDVQVTRDGTGVTGDAKLDARVVLWEAIEFVDVNNDCLIGERDIIVNRVPLKDLTWSAVVKTDSNGATFYTITVQEANGYFTFVFVVSADKYTVGERTIPPGARMTLETAFPWQKTTSKLMLVFKVIVAGGYTIDAPTAASNLVVFNSAGTAIGNFQCDVKARVGAAGSVDIKLGLAGDTTTSDSAAGVVLAANARSYTLRACVDTFGAPDRIVYDPVLAPSDFAPTGPANAAASCQPQLILAILAAVLCTILRQF